MARIKNRNVTYTPLTKFLQNSQNNKLKDSLDGYDNVMQSWHTSCLHCGVTIKFMDNCNDKANGFEKLGSKDNGPIRFLVMPLISIADVLPPQIDKDTVEEVVCSQD